MNTEQKSTDSRAETIERARRIFASALEAAPVVDGGGGRFAVTNDRAVLGEDSQLAHSFEKAWRIFGSLVYMGRMTVNFSEPDWAQQVMFTVETIAQDITSMSHSS